MNSFVGYPKYPLDSNKIFVNFSVDPGKNCGTDHYFLFQNGIINHCTMHIKNAWAKRNKVTCLPIVNTGLAALIVHLGRISGLRKIPQRFLLLGQGYIHRIDH